MAFLRINGWACDAMIDGFRNPDESVESYSRAVNDEYVGLTYSPKKGYEFTTPPLSQSDAAAVEGWVRGLGHHWSFQRVDGATVRFTATSQEAGLVFAGGSLSSTPFYGVWGLLVSSGGSSTATALFGSEGDFTIQAYHRVSGGSFVSYVVRSLNGTIDAWASGTTTATARMFNFTAASGSLGVVLLGRDSAGSNATAQYSGVKILPYAAMTNQILSMATLPFGLPSTIGPARAPYVTLTGDALAPGGPAVNGAGERGGKPFKVFVSEHNVMPVVINGQFRYNARSLAIRLTEK